MLGTSLPERSASRSHAMPPNPARNRTLKVVAAIAASFIALVATIVFLSEMQIIGVSSPLLARMSMSGIGPLGAASLRAIRAVSKPSSLVLVSQGEFHAQDPLDHRDAFGCAAARRRKSRRRPVLHATQPCFRHSRTRHSHRFVLGQCV